MTVERLRASLSDRYRIERELGQGGMATVYLAYDVKHDRKVALKVLKPELSAILGADRFLHEIKTTANLQHPHILSLFDSGEAEGMVFYVMPFVEGESLRDRLTRDKQLPVEDAVRIAREVADALDYAHRHGVVHRDIKPENILLHDGRAQVADFGIALAAARTDGGSRMTETGMSLGTPSYMSPEQAMGEREITARSDIYALGCVTYEMLAGEPPFMGPTAQAIIARVMTEPPRSLQLQRHTVPTHVEAAVQRALEKLPADRFQSAAEFATALADERAATRAAHTGGPSARPRVRIAALGAIAVLAALAAWGWLRPIPEAPVLRYELGLPPGQELAEVRGSRVALSDDGTRMAYVGPGQRLWLRQRRALRAEPLPGTQRGTNPWFSPDGSKMVFVSEEAPAVLRVASATGAPTITLSDSGIGLDGNTWGGDGYIYFDGLTAGGIVGLRRIPEAGGAAETITTVDTARREVDHVWPAALPDGRGVLFIIQSREADAGTALAVFDGRSRRYHVLVKAVAGRYLAPGYLLYVTGEGQLVSVPFDLDRLAITGEARVVADGVGLRAFGAADIAVSSTGTVLYRAGGGSAAAPAQVVRVSREGQAVPLVQGWSGDFRTLSLSRDGRLLAVSIVQGNGQHLWVKQLPDGALSKLTLEGTSNYRPSWSPDGRSVIFTSQRRGVEELFGQRADGSAAATLLVGHQQERTISEGFISRDGQWLIYRTVPRDILGRRLGPDTSAVDFVTAPASDYQPALSPDGRWLAYASDESGQPEVYVRPFPGTDAARWQVSTSGGDSPLWSRSGRELFYVTLQDSLVTATVPAGASFSVRERKTLFSTSGIVSGIRTWDVSADDQSFIMIRQLGSESGAAALTMIENLPRELKSEGVP